MFIIPVLSGVVFFFFKPILAYTFLSLNLSILPQQETLFATSISVFH